MKHLNKMLVIVMTFSSANLFGQSGQEVEMADVLRQDGKIYTVVFGLVIILTAMIVLLIRVDRKLSRLEKQSGRSGKM